MFLLSAVVKKTKCIVDTHITKERQMFNYIRIVFDGETF